MKFGKKNLLAVTIIVLVLVALIIFYLLQANQTEISAFDEDTQQYFELGKIILSFKTDAGDVDIFNLLDEHELEIISTIVWKENFRKLATIRVPVGKEKYYLSMLKQNSLVIGGQLNYAHKMI